MNLWKRALVTFDEVGTVTVGISQPFLLQNYRQNGFRQIVHLYSQFKHSEFSNTYRGRSRYKNYRSEIFDPFTLLSKT